MIFTIILSTMQLSTPVKISMFRIFTIIVMIALVALSTYFYIKYKNEQSSNPLREFKDTITAVSKLIELPENEEPNIATVTEKEKLVDQVFFKNSENGDKVLIYVKTGKAILFRPSINKIIDVTAINNNPTQVENIVQKEEPTPSPQIDIVDLINKPVTITLLNGTTKLGITTAIESKIESEFENFTVVNRETAQKTTYEKTIIIDITGENSEAIELLSPLVDGVAGTLPSGEILPESDILIILGDKLIPTE
jgi:hypothetical protein